MMIQQAERPDIRSELKLSSAVAAIAGAATGAATEKARQLRATGRSVIEMARGEPHFDTPEHVRRAAIDAIARGETRYTSVDGTPALKDAVREKFRRENELEFSSDQISIASGCKQVIYNALISTLHAGDEVVIPAPYWDCYPSMTRLAGGSPVFVPCSPQSDFRVQPDDLDAAITARTRWVLLNSPTNPTGAIYSPEQLARLAEVLSRHPEVWVISDEIYEHIAYDSKPTSFAAIAPQLAARTLTVGGVSKTYAMTGFRIGWGAGPSALIKAMARLQSNSTSNPCSISQAAAVEALTSPVDFLSARLRDLRARRDEAIAGLNRAPGIRCTPPLGAFFAFANCQDVLGKRTPDGRLLRNDVDFVDALLDREGVAVTQGSAFGCAGYFRLTFGVPQETLADACLRIGRFCSELA